MRLKMTIIQAQDGAMKTAGAPIGTALDADHPAAHLNETPAEGAMIGPAASAENDQQAQPVMTVAGTDIAAIETVTLTTKIKNAHLGGIVARDRALARRKNHAALRRGR